MLVVVVVVVLVVAVVSVLVSEVVVAVAVVAAGVGGADVSATHTAYHCYDQYSWSSTVGEIDVVGGCSCCSSSSCIWG